MTRQQSSRIAFAWLARSLRSSFDAVGDLLLALAPCYPSLATSPALPLAISDGGHQDWGLELAIPLC